MRNHDQKAKDMAESVLPSTGRRGARDSRRAAHQRHRSHERDQLRHLQLAGLDGDFDTSLERRRAGDLDDLICDRRGADKTGPLERWARVRVHRDPALRERPLDEQVAELARLLPKNLIGRHATQHIRWALERDQRRAMWRRSDDVSDELTASIADVRRLLELGRHREVNAAIRAMILAEKGPDGRPWLRPVRTANRLLGGLHDVEDFAEAHYLNTAVRALLARLADVHRR